MRPPSKVRVPSRRFGHRRVRALGRRTARKRELECPAGLPPEPDPLRSRHRRLGSAVRVAEDALHEQRLPARLDRRGRLQLHAGRWRQERSRSADRRGDRGPQAGNGQGQGRRGRALTGHFGDVRLPHQRRHRRTAARERGALHQRRWPGPESRRADARRMGRQGHTRSAHGRRAERHDPQPNARADMHLGGVVPSPTTGS